MPCTDDGQCSTSLCYENFCREPLNPLIVFAVIVVSLVLLFVILGIVYLTCHDKRMKKEQEMIRKLKEEALLYKGGLSNLVMKDELNKGLLMGRGLDTQVLRTDNDRLES